LIAAKISVWPPAEALNSAVINSIAALFFATDISAKVKSRSARSVPFN
jgi:hypothetical protein